MEGQRSMDKAQPTPGPFDDEMLGGNVSYSAIIEPVSDSVQTMASKCMLLPSLVPRVAAEAGRPDPPMIGSALTRHAECTLKLKNVSAQITYGAKRHDVHGRKRTSRQLRSLSLGAPD